MALVDDLFSRWQIETARVRCAWRGTNRERKGFELAVTDAMHHLTYALDVLAPFDRATDPARLLAREAFLSALAFVYVLEQIADDGLAPRAAVAHARTATEQLLAELSGAVAPPERAKLGRAAPASPPVPPGPAPCASGHGTWPGTGVAP